jgi:hypothetical protein
MHGLFTEILFQANYVYDTEYMMVCIICTVLLCQLLLKGFDNLTNFRLCSAYITDVQHVSKHTILFDRRI